MDRRNSLESRRQHLQIQIRNYHETRDTCSSSHRELFEILANYASRALDELDGFVRADTPTQRMIPTVRAEPRCSAKMTNRMR